MTFRNSIFDLCNQLKKKEEVSQLKELLFKLNICPEKGEFLNRSDFGYIARRYNNQFHGYLFTDDNIDSFKKDSTFNNLSKLSEDERSIIECGHYTIQMFIDECLNDLKTMFPNIDRILNPYSRYKAINQSASTPIIEKDKLADAISSFKNSPVYKAIVSSTIGEYLKKISEEQYFQMVELMSIEINKSFGTVSKDIKEFAMRYTAMQRQPQDVLFKDVCYLISLREMLSVAAQLLFTAMVGEDLVVLDNDNIISIEENSFNVVYQYVTVLAQDLVPVSNVELIGGVVLIKCELPDGHTIKEFGTVKKTTMNLNVDTGLTTRLSFAILDEHLNPISNLIN